MRHGDIYGMHRVLEPAGVLPQPALRIDSSMELYDNELMADVDILNIDSASFTQIVGETGRDEAAVAARIIDIVNDRGKMQNPVTGSGGMFIGRVRETGPAFPDQSLTPGTRIASLVSLSLTPLAIDEILGVNLDNDQVRIRGRAILFASGLYARLPDDLPDALSLSVLDVAGAPAQTARLVRPGDTVLIAGAGGKSGLLCLHEAKKAAGPAGKVIALDYGEDSIARIERTGLADELIRADATDALSVLAAVREATAGALADLSINCVNIPNTEMACILSTRQGGRVYFFSMATSFTRAALGAEGVGKDIEMIIGNGYARGHAELALNALRENRIIRDLYTRLFA
jgi:L-erythro-3,5-diaminohexanoate dehydrogenase